MGVHTNYIAALDSGGDPIPAETYNFCDLNGTIVLSTRTIEVIQRPGVDGSFFRRHAYHGRPFTLVSINYVFDWDAARAALAAYDELKNSQYGVEIVKQSQ